jgi:hypothetical protein
MKVDIRSIEYNKKIGILTKLSECVWRDIVWPSFESH